MESISSLRGFCHGVVRTEETGQQCPGSMDGQTYIGKIVEPLGLGIVGVGFEFNAIGFLSSC